MMKLSVTARDANLNPAVSFNSRNEFPDLHRDNLPSSFDIISHQRDVGYNLSGPRLPAWRWLKATA